MITALNLNQPDNPEDFRTEKLQPIADYIRRHRLKQLPPQVLIPLASR
jgi:hypothetical protein